MLAKFWGVRGSIPAPLGADGIKEKITQALVRADGVDLSTPEKAAAFVETLPPEIIGTTGGNTPCMDVRIGDLHLIFDCGSGLRMLGNALMKKEFGRGEGEAHIFISHTHWDHIQGFPFFVPAYIPGNKFHIYSPKQNIKERFKVQQTDQDMFPVLLDDMGADIEFVTIPETGVELGDVKIECLQLHHPGGSWAYRVNAGDKSLVYATDGEYKDLSQTALQPYLDFMTDADALVFDSMYTFTESVTKEGWGHSTSLVGVDLAVRTRVKRLILFHHEPNYNDMQLKEIVAKTEQYYALVREQGHLDVILAVEGLELEL